MLQGPDHNQDERHRCAAKAYPGGERPQSDGQRIFLGFGQICSTRPSESSAASDTASDMVGWA
jgi:hypothetical protein